MKQAKPKWLSIYVDSDLGFFKFHTTRIVTGKQAKPKCLFMSDSVVDTWVDVWVFL